MPAGVAHKDKLGLVAVGIEDEAALQEKFKTLSARAQQHGFAASELTFLVQPMVASRHELLAGVSWEPGLGHFLVFGLGGVHTELLDQVELLPLPLPRPAIRAKLAASVAGRVLRTRDDKDQAFEQFVDVLDRLQTLIASCGEEIASIDINPVLLGAKGCVAVDGLIVRRAAATQSLGA
jgi:acetate---CoA ligase (ADP-forming)